MPSPQAGKQATVALPPSPGLDRQADGRCRSRGKHCGDRPGRSGGPVAFCSLAAFSSPAKQEQEAQ
eukprot:5587529-Lingulodinium_polyedra.AAC.1